MCPIVQLIKTTWYLFWGNHQKTTRLNLQGIKKIYNNKKGNLIGLISTHYSYLKGVINPEDNPNPIGRKSSANTNKNTNPNEFCLSWFLQKKAKTTPANAVALLFACSLQSDFLPFYSPPAPLILGFTDSVSYIRIW